jgi:hypothetical protein
MLMAHAFAFSEGVPYGGACHDTEPTSPDGNDAVIMTKLIEALGLTDTLPFACPTSRNGILMNQKDYYTKDIAIFTVEWLAYIRSKVKYTHPLKDAVTNIAVHIRRGDVNPCQYPNRYLPNSHYIKILDKFMNESNAKDSSTRYYNVTIFFV